MAIKMSDPIGNPLYGPLIARVVLGGYFIIVGWSKLHNLAGFVREVQEFHILPPQLATLYGILLPYVEIGTGALLVLGLWTTLAAILSSLMLASFIIAFGLFPGKLGLPNKDLILLALALSFLYSGGGGFSIDRFRKSG